MNKWAKLVGNVGKNQYEQRLQFLNNKGIKTTEIKSAVNGAISSFSSDEAFVIYGEPQSGKTEMMIALNAKLLDDGCDVIINLLTDSVDLLNQSISRFQNAGLSPSPKVFDDLPLDHKSLDGKQWVIFCKKNARDLEKLLDATRFMKRLVIIDDEADYATPNGKVNKEDEKTKINSLIHELIHERGKYIGVTATPARLDLNNTYNNKTEKWIHFKPHSQYVGQEFFFPDDRIIRYRLNQFNAEEGNERIELRNAILHFLCGVAEQHQRGIEKNFSMLVHISGKTSEHQLDIEVLQKTLNILSSSDHSNFNQHTDLLEQYAVEYNSTNPHSIVEFIMRNIHRHHIVEINSKNKNKDKSILLNPKSLFSFGAGGNIISRGVTFENLLSMYFTRAVKGKYSQDTYIQRARMFGARNEYKNHFQLWIPSDLMQNWYHCFEFHKLALESAKLGSGAPVWISAHNTTPTSSASIDRSSVDFEGGEMSFKKFKYTPELDTQIIQNNSLNNSQKLKLLKDNLGGDLFPEHIKKYISKDISNPNAYCFHPSENFGSKSKTYTEQEIKNIRRSKGIFTITKRGPNPNARHHLKIFYNKHDEARLFYKLKGDSVKFMQNKK